MVGSRHYNGFGSHGAANHVELDYYASLEDCCNCLKHEKHCRIVGVEIMPAAKAVHEHPFSGPTAFMLGNEVSQVGLNIWIQHHAIQVVCNFDVLVGPSSIHYNIPPTNGHACVYIQPSFQVLSSICSRTASLGGCAAGWAV